MLNGKLDEKKLQQAVPKRNHLTCGEAEPEAGLDLTSGGMGIQGKKGGIKSRIGACSRKSGSQKRSAVICREIWVQRQRRGKSAFAGAGRSKEPGQGAV